MYTITYYYINEYYTIADADVRIYRLCKLCMLACVNINSAGRLRMISHINDNTDNNNTVNHNTSNNHHNNDTNDTDKLCVFIMFIV